MKELQYLIRLLSIEVMLENDKLREEKRERNKRERRVKSWEFIEFPYKLRGVE